MPRKPSPKGPSWSFYLTRDKKYGHQYVIGSYSKWDVENSSRALPSAFMSVACATTVQSARARPSCKNFLSTPIRKSFSLKTKFWTELGICRPIQMRLQNGASFVVLKIKLNPRAARKSLKRIGDASYARAVLRMPLGSTFAKAVSWKTFSRFSVCRTASS